MRLPRDPGVPVVPPAQPTRDLLLAQALDACITAERCRPGSSQAIIARQPAWARADLQRLVDLAGSLDAAASNAVMSSEFRVAARARLMQRIAGKPGVHAQPARLRLAGLTPVSSSQWPRVVLHRRKTFWAWRATAGLLAAVLAVGATLTASANALPGEPLYSLKQAHEELGVRLAADDQERALALLRQADARLAETARLLQLGRTVDASETTQRYDLVLERAMSAYAVTAGDGPQPVPATVRMDARLSQEQDQLQAMLQSAPEQARPGLREALVTTERGRALVADPQPVERALGRGDRRDAALAVAVPTVAVEESPTLVPTEPPVKPTALAVQRPLIVPPTPTPPVVVRGNGSDASRAGAPQPAPADDQGAGQHANAVAPASRPVGVARGDREDLAMHNGGGSDGYAADTQGQDMPQPIAARSTPEATNNGGRGVVGGPGAKSSGGDGASGGAPRTVPAQVVSPPEPANVAGPGSSTQHPNRDNSAGVRVPPTPTATPTKPPAAAMPTPSDRHGSQPEANKGDGPQKSGPSPASHH